MTSKQWLAVFLVAFLGAALGIAAINYRLNAFGVFGDVHGKSYRCNAQGMELQREYKYLFSLNYIPQNFDGVMVGTSVTGNWNTRELSSARVYNLSMDGSNTTEMRILAQNVIARGKVRLLLVCIHPYMFKDHGRILGHLDAKDYWGTFGSLDLLREYKNQVLLHYGRWQSYADDFGVADYTGKAAKAKALNHGEIGAGYMKERPVVVDPQAIEEYRLLLQAARSAGVRIVAVVPPHLDGLWNTPDYSSFESKVRQLFHPEAGELWIDFNASAYDGFRREHANFYDGMHLTQDAELFICKELNRDLLQAGVLR